MFDPQHLEGASTELVQSMFKIGRKATELLRQKLQVEIQKEKSEIRWKKLEKGLIMAGKAGGQSGLAKGPRKTKNKREEEDEDWLDNLVVDIEQRQTSYSNLEPGGFVTKGAHRKTRLDQRQAKIAVAAGKLDDDNDEEETEQERLEREASELSSQLKKVEKAEAQAHEKNKETRLSGTANT